eukprot:5888928-Pleurochrysis_carterae.AAC.1
MLFSTVEHGTCAHAYIAASFVDVLPCSQDFRKESLTEGMPKEETCESSWFKKIFREAPELCNITVPSGKESFGSGAPLVSVSRRK